MIEAGYARKSIMAMFIAFAECSDRASKMNWLEQAYLMNDQPSRLLKKVRRKRMRRRLVVNFELHCSVGEGDKDCQVKTPADMQFVADLIREFRKESGQA